VISFTNAPLPSFAARLRRYAYPNLSHRKAFASLAEIAEKLAPALVIESASRKFAPATGIHRPWRGIIYWCIARKMLCNDGSISAIAPFCEDQCYIKPNYAGTCKFGYQQPWSYQSLSSYSPDNHNRFALHFVKSFPRLLFNCNINASTSELFEWYRESLAPANSAENPAGLYQNLRAVWKFL
jgi:hypothetical protein